MKSIRMVMFLLAMSNAFANAEPNATRSVTLTPEAGVGIDAVNTMLAFSVMDVFFTGAAVTTFYYANGRQLCSFGKSQAIPFANGVAMLVSSSAARATGNPYWIAAASLFSTIQGVINPFRAYLGIWYHFYGGQPLPLMPEGHDNFIVVEEGAFRLDRFLSLGHHWDVSRGIMQEIILSHDRRGAQVFMGVMLIGPPLITFASGLVQLGVGLYGSFRI